MRYHGSTCFEHEQDVATIRARGTKAQAREPVRPATTQTGIRSRRLTGGVMIGEAGQTSVLGELDAAYEIIVDVAHRDQVDVCVSRS